MSACAIKGCDRKHDAKGLCRIHYGNQRRNGNPLAPRKIAPRGAGWIQRGYKYFTVNGRNVPEHITIVERVLGRPLSSETVVHHVDENRKNNKNSNLVVCPNNRYHRLLHVRMNAFAACGNPNWRKCPYCHQYDDTNKMRGEKCGRFVHRECSATARRIAYAKRRKYDI